MPFFFRRILIGLYEWLACSEAASDVDLIFVPAGRQTRKLCALRMVADGRASRLLLSVGRYEVRSFDELTARRPNLRQIAALISPHRRHFFVHLSNEGSEIKLVRKGYFGTLTEISALREWLEKHKEIRSVLIVSSAPHLRRLRLCGRRLLTPLVEFRLAMVTGEDASLREDQWWRTNRTRMMVLGELPKLLLYKIYLGLPLEPPRTALPRLIRILNETS